MVIFLGCILVFSMMDFEFIVVVCVGFQGGVLLLEFCYIKDWNVVQKDCYFKGGILVMVNDRVEQDFFMFVLKVILFYGIGIWLGYNDMIYEGIFIWVIGYFFLNFIYENIYKI